jgi:hypothetical protein
MSSKELRQRIENALAGVEGDTAPVRALVFDLGRRLQHAGQDRDRLTADRASLAAQVVALGERLRVLTDQAQAARERAARQVAQLEARLAAWEDEAGRPCPGDPPAQTHAWFACKHVLRGTAAMAYVWPGELVACQECLRSADITSERGIARGALQPICAVCLVKVLARHPRMDVAGREYVEWAAALGHGHDNREWMATGPEGCCGPGREPLVERSNHYKEQSP